MIWPICPFSKSHVPLDHKCLFSPSLKEEHVLRQSVFLPSVKIVSIFPWSLWRCNDTVKIVFGAAASKSSCSLPHKSIMNLLFYDKKRILISQQITSHMIYVIGSLKCLLVLLITGPNVLLLESDLESTRSSAGKRVLLILSSNFALHATIAC